MRSVRQFRRPGRPGRTAGHRPSKGVAMRLTARLETPAPTALSANRRLGPAGAAGRGTADLCRRKREAESTQSPAPSRDTGSTTVPWRCREQGLGKGLRLRRRDGDHLVAADLRLLAMGASGCNQERSERQHCGLLHKRGLRRSSVSRVVWRRAAASPSYPLSRAQAQSPSADCPAPMVGARLSRDPKRGR